MRKYIGIAGMMGSGKTACAKRLAEHGFLRISFARALRDELASLLCSVEAFGELAPVKNRQEAAALLSVKPTPPEVRRALQAYGYCRRAANPNYWVDKWDAVVRGVSNSVVADDVRFDTEAKHIPGLGGIVLSLVRDRDACLRSAGATDDMLEHQSERGVSPEFVSAYVDADGPLSDLLARVDYCLRHYNELRQCRGARVVGTPARIIPAPTEVRAA